MMAESPPGFHCTQCGECCRNLNADWKVFLNFEDVQRLAAHLHLRPEAVVATHCNDESFELGDECVEIFSLKSVDGKCLLLNENNLCSVHEAKPAQCRFGPFGLFWTGERHYECMLDVKVPADWTSDCNDASFVNGIRRFKRNGGGNVG
jgi:Fe-S-cluster containining protein